MDLKYGYITGTNQFFFQISVIDAFDRSVPAFHLGLSATAKDAARVLANALSNRSLEQEVNIQNFRTDNGPQFVAKAFQGACESLGVIHERIPVKSPSMNAYIESVHGILEDDCYTRHEFQNFEDVYRTVSEYMEYYNYRRRHGSINNMAPMKFYEASLDKQAPVIQLVA